MISIELIQYIFEKFLFSISLRLSLHKSVEILSKRRLLKHLRYLQMIQIGVSVDEKHESEYTVTDNILKYKSCETET